MADWTSLPVPLAAGMRAGDDEQLPTPHVIDAVNVTYEKEGALSPRPGFVEDARPFQFQEGFPLLGTVTYESLQERVASNGVVPRALIADTGAHGSQPGILADGRYWRANDDCWVDYLSAWSSRVTRGVGVRSLQLSDLTAPSLGLGYAGDLAMTVQTGLNLLSDNCRSSQGVVAPVAGNTGRMYGCALDPFTAGSVSAMFWINNATNNLHCAIRNAGALTLTQTTVATNASATVAQPLCAWADEATNQFYVAYATTTANQVTVVRVSTTGVAGTTLSYNFGNPITCVAITGRSTRLCLAVATSAGTNIRTRIINSTTMLDAGLNWDSATSTGVAPGNGLTAGMHPTADQVWLTWPASSSLDVAVRQVTAGTGSIVRTLPGGGSGGVTGGVAGVSWGSLHQPVVFSGRVIIGVMCLVSSASPTISTDQQGQWFEIDVTDWVSFDASTLRGVMVARGPVRSSASVGGASTAHNPGSAVVGSDFWRFLAIEGDVFEATGPTIFTQAVMEVRPNQPVFSESQGTTIFGGNVPMEVAGSWATEVGFPFLAGPEIGVEVVAGGAVPAGSYTIVAVWRWTDGLGRVHRSLPSLPITVNPAAGNLTITVAVTRCTISSKQGFVSGAGSGDVWADIYVSNTNPGPNDPLYKRTSVSARASTTSAFTVLTTYTAMGTVSSAEILYTTGGVLPNYPPRCDGGLTVGAGRVWAAGQDRVLASKILRPGDAPSWNDEGILEVRVPARAGGIRSLTSFDDKVLIFCERGVYLTGGSGPDDLGRGDDFIPPFPVSDLGVAGGRCAVSTPDGTVFLSTPANNQEPGIHAVDRSLVVKRVGGPVVQHITADEGLLTYNTNENRVHVMGLSSDGTSARDTQLVLDLDAGRWARWDGVLGTLNIGLVAVAGVLHRLGSDRIGAFTGVGLTAQGEYVGSGFETDDAGSRAVDGYPMTVLTSRIPADAGDGLGWSRVRAVSVLGRNAAKAVFANQTVEVDFDGRNNFASVSGTAFLPTGADGNPSTAGTGWPVNRHEQEYRLPRQKCSTIQVRLTAVPAGTQWNSLRLEIKPLGTRAPSQERS